MTIVPDCEQITRELNDLKLKIAKMKARRNAQIDHLQKNLLGSSSQIRTFNPTKPQTYYEYNQLYSNNPFLYSPAYPWRSSSLDSLLADKYDEYLPQRYKHSDNNTAANRLERSTDLNLRSSGILSKLKDFVFEQEREVTNNLLRRIAQARASSYDRYPSYCSRIPESGRSYQPVVSLAKKSPPFLNPINKKDNFSKRYNAFMKKILKPPTAGKSKLTDDYAADNSWKYQYSPLKYRYGDDLYYDPYYKWPRWYRYSSPFIRNRYGRYWYDYDGEDFDYDYYKTESKPAAIVPRDVEAIINANSKYNPAMVKLPTKCRPFFPTVPFKYDHYDPYESDSYLRTGLPNWKQYYYTQKLKSKPSHLRFLDDYYDPYLDFFPDDASAVAAFAADKRRRRPLINDADDESPPDEAEKLVDRYRDAIYEDIIRNLRKKKLRKSHSTRSPVTSTTNGRKLNKNDTRNDASLSSGKYESNRGISSANVVKTCSVSSEETEPQNSAAQWTSSQLRNAYSSSAAEYEITTRDTQTGTIDSEPSKKFATTSYKMLQQPSLHYSTALPRENQNENTCTSLSSAANEQSMTADKTELTRLRSAQNEARPFDAFNTLAVSNKNSTSKLPQSSYSTTALLNNPDTGPRTHYMPQQTAVDYLVPTTVTYSAPTTVDYSAPTTVDYSAPTTVETSYTSSKMSAVREKSPSRYIPPRHERQFFSATKLSDSQSPERSAAVDGVTPHYSFADYSRQSPLKTEYDATKYKSQGADKESNYSRPTYSNIDNRSIPQRQFDESPSRLHERRTVLSSPSPPPTSQLVQTRTTDSSIRPASSKHAKYVEVASPAPSAAKNNEPTYTRSLSFKHDTQFSQQNQPSVTTARPATSQQEPLDLEPRDLLQKRHSKSLLSNEITDNHTTSQPTEKQPEVAPRKQSSSSIHEFQKPFSRHSSATKLIVDDQSPKRSTKSPTDEFFRRTSAKEFDQESLQAASTNQDVVGVLSRRDSTVVDAAFAMRTHQPPPLSRRNSVKPFLRKASIQSTNLELISNATKPVEPYSIEEESNATINDSATALLSEQTAFDAQTVLNVDNSETRSQNLEPYRDDGAYYDQNVYGRDYVTYDSHGRYLGQTDTNQIGGGQLDYYQDGNYNNAYGDQAYGDQAYGDYASGYYDQNLAAYTNHPATIYPEQSGNQYAGQNYAQQDHVDGYPSVSMNNEPPPEVNYSLASVDENKSENLNDNSTNNRERDVIVDDATATQDTNVTDNIRTNVTKSVNRRNSIVSKQLVRKASKVGSPSTEEKKSSSKTSSLAVELQKRTSKPKIVESRFRRAANAVKNNARAPAKKT